MIRITAEASPELQKNLAKVNPTNLVKFLRTSVRKNARPTVNATQAATPVKSGLLRQSIGATIKINRSRGEVFAIVGPRDNTVMGTDENNLTVFTSSTLKSLTRNDNAKLHGLHKRGIRTVSQRTPFKYVYGIEYGQRRSGKIARHAGGAKMLTRGFDAGSQPYIDGLATDLQTFLAHEPAPT
jgi:hypothetical protein